MMLATALWLDQLEMEATCTNMHVQRFQDSNERTDKNPCLGLRRGSVKQGVGERLSFLKEYCFRVRVRVDTNPNPNPNPKPKPK